MKKISQPIFLFLIISLFIPSSGFAWRKWEFINPSDVQITIRTMTPEIVAGEIATFTISVRNRTDKPIAIPFPTGQRWDMAAFHEGTQIWRWSQVYYIPPVKRIYKYFAWEDRKITSMYDKDNKRKRWEESLHTVEINPGASESYQMGWRTIDRNGAPLPQGIYRVEGTVMTIPRHLVSNMVDVRLLPPKNPNKGIIKVKLGATFQIELPQFIDNNEITWQVQYIFNDNRIREVSERRIDKKVLKVFRTERRGHVIMHFYGHSVFKDQTISYERQTFRIEIFEEEK